MPEYSDIYILTDKRDSTIVEEFLNRFLPQREESTDEYEVPQNSENPETLFKQARKLIEYCETNRNVEHSLY